MSEQEDEISAIKLDLNHNNSILEEENKKLQPLRDKKMECVAKLQKLNLEMENLDEEEARVKNLHNKLKKNLITIDLILRERKVYLLMLILMKKEYWVKKMNY